MRELFNLGKTKGADIREVYPKFTSDITPNQRNMRTWVRIYRR